MNPIEEILARAMAKSASDTARSDENSKDVKDNIVASVDETNSSDAFGLVDKENTVILTGQEATTDDKVDGLPKITNDGDAFKEASAAQLASLASDVMATIVKASADALDVEAPENGAQTENSPDAVGEEEDVSDNGTEAVGGKKAAGLPDSMTDDGDSSADPEAKGDTVATDASGEEEKKAADLEQELETFLTLREKFAGIEEMLGGVDEQAGDDAGNVAEFLSAFQQAPAIDGMAEEGGEEGLPPEAMAPGAIAPEAVAEELPEEGLGGLEDAGLEDGGGEEAGAIEELIQVLEEAGISPEDFTQQVGDLGQEEAKIASASSDGWKKLSKEAKRSLVEEALRKNLTK